jgi:hypothetical protein
MTGGPGGAEGTQGVPSFSGYPFSKLSIFLGHGMGSDGSGVLLRRDWGHDSRKRSLMGGPLPFQLYGPSRHQFQGCPSEKAWDRAGHGVAGPSLYLCREFCTHPLLSRARVGGNPFLWNLQEGEPPAAVSFPGGLSTQLACVTNTIPA